MAPRRRNDASLLRMGLGSAANFIGSSPLTEADLSMATIHAFLLRSIPLRVAIGVVLCGLNLHAQSSSDTEVLHVQSRLIVADVIVQDASGNPVRGLTRNNFVVEEDGVPQPLHTFEHHSAADAGLAGPKLPELARGNFTNYTPLPPGGTLNILLLDTLNTSIKDQVFLRAQLQKYLDHDAEQQSLAIFTLNRHLLMLQGFTSDPRVLRAALARKDAIRGSDLLDDVSGSDADPPSIGDQIAARAPGQLTATGSGFAQVLSNVQQFEAETRAETLQLRAQYTLDAMDALAHYLSNYPGRKNVIWFSGSFPFSLLPDPQILNGFNAMNLDAAEFQDTVALLAKAQVAVYPVDARGGVAPTPFDAANSGRKYATAPAATADDVSAFNSGQMEANMTLQAMAEGTGGRAFVGTNATSRMR
jgi:VWFA-related protein